MMTIKADIMNIDVISICKDAIINAMKNTLNITDKFDEYILEQLSKNNDYEIPSKTLINKLLDNELSEEQSKVLTPIVEHQVEILHNPDGNKKDFMPFKRILTIVTNTEYVPAYSLQDIFTHLKPDFRRMVVMYSLEEWLDIAYDKLVFQLTHKE